MSSSHAAHVEEFCPPSDLAVRAGDRFPRTIGRAVYATAARIADRAVTRSARRLVHAGPHPRPIGDQPDLGIPLMFLLFTVMFCSPSAAPTCPPAGSRGCWWTRSTRCCARGAGLGLPWWLWGC